MGQAISLFIIMKDPHVTPTSGGVTRDGLKAGLPRRSLFSLLAMTFAPVIASFCTVIWQKSSLRPRHRRGWQSRHSQSLRATVRERGNLACLTTRLPVPRSLGAAGPRPSRTGSQ